MQGLHFLFQTPIAKEMRLKQAACLLFLLFLFSSFSVHAVPEATVITENTESLNLVSIAEYLEDSQGVLRAEDLEKPEVMERFKTIEQGVLNRGLTRSVIWLRFDLKYISYVGDEVGEWLVEIAYPALDLVTLYVSDPWDGFQEYHSGDKYPFDIRSVAHPRFIFPVELFSGDSTRFYLRIETSGSMQIPVKLWTPLAYVEHTSKVDTLQGVVFGIMLVMLCYNLVLLMTLRDVSYLFYSTYIASFLLYLLSIKGTGIALIWPSLPIVNSAAPFFMSVTGIAGLLFAQSFLKLGEKSRRLNKIYIAFLLVGIFIMPLTLIVDHGLAAKMVMAQVLPTIPLLMLTGLYYWLYKQDRSARFFFMAFATLLIGGCIYGAMLLGLMPSNVFTRNIISVGIAIEVTLLSLALASRIRHLKDEMVEIELTANTELEKLNQRLVEGSRLKDEFLHAVSHELRTPMNGVMGALDLIESDDQELLTAARESAQDMNEIIANLLSLTEVQSGTVALQKAPFHIGRQLAILEEQYKPACDKKGLSITVTVKDEVPDILYGDSDKLLKALSYVLDNAVKFTHEGGVAIEASVRPHDKPEKIRLYLSVSDTGIGIETRPGRDIYQAFEQLDGSSSRAYGGLGLGLSVCRQLMHIMGGTISHSPRPGGGTVFELSVSCYLQVK